MNEATTQFLGHAARQDDRYLFICAIAILIIGGVMAIRYLVNKNDKAEERINALLLKITEEQNERATQLALCIDRNTKALADNADVLSDCRDEIRRTREK